MEMTPDEETLVSESPPASCARTRLTNIWVSGAIWRRMGVRMMAIMEGENDAEYWVDGDRVEGRGLT